MKASIFLITPILSSKQALDTVVKASVEVLTLPLISRVTSDHGQAFHSLGRRVPMVDNSCPFHKLVIKGK